MSARVWFMPLYWNWLNNLCCLLFGKDFSGKKKSRTSSEKKIGDRQKYTLRNIGSLVEKKLFSTFKVNKVNLRGKHTLPNGQF